MAPCDHFPTSAPCGVTSLRETRSKRLMGKATLKHLNATHPCFFDICEKGWLHKELQWVSSLSAINTRSLKSDLSPLKQQSSRETNDMVARTRESSNLPLFWHTCFLEIRPTQVCSRQQSADHHAWRAKFLASQGHYEPQQNRPAERSRC